MTIRSKSVGCTGMKISFFDKYTMTLGDYVKISSYFDHLKFYTFDKLFPGQFHSYELLQVNLDFHIERACCTLMWNFYFHNECAQWCVAMFQFFYSGNPMLLSCTLMCHVLNLVIMFINYDLMIYSQKLAMTKILNIRFPENKSLKHYERIFHDFYKYSNYTVF